MLTPTPRSTATPRTPNQETVAGMKPGSLSSEKSEPDDWLFEHQLQIGIFVGLACAIGCLISCWRVKKPITEKIGGWLILNALAGFGIVQMSLLLYASAMTTEKDASKLNKIHDLPAYVAFVAFGGIVLTTITVVKTWKDAAKD